MLYKENMAIRLNNFHLEQLRTEVYMCKKNKQLYQDALFWNSLSKIYNSAYMFKETIWLINLVDRMVN